MIQITPQMRIVVAIEPADFRKGIDGLARLCQEVLKRDPFSGLVFVFRNRRATAIKSSSTMAKDSGSATSGFPAASIAGGREARARKMSPER
jgi:transposase